MKSIFVFGSNEAGRHGGGAAKYALNNFGAIYGKGYGLQGNCYAIPTKDRNIETLPLNKIKLYVDHFLEVAEKYTDYIFFVTAIGCGLAGYSPKDIAPMFSKVPSNVILNDQFIDWLKENKNRE